MTITTVRPCYVCQTANNPIVATEPIEHRLGRPVLPEATYVLARCSRCSTLYVDSEVTDAYLANLYVEETIESVAEIIGEQGHDQIVRLRLPEFRRHWAEMKRYRALEPSDRLLDFGCQTGEFGRLAQADGVLPSGVELSRSYAAVARAAWGEGSYIHCSDIESAPFHGGEFAYISTFETLEHLSDPRRVLRYLRRWIAADGVLAISVPSSDYFHFKYWLLKKSPVARVLRKAMRTGWSSCTRQVLPHTHLYNFSDRSVRLLLEQSGFQAVHVGLTGWHGKLGMMLTPLGDAVNWLSKQRIGFAPSLFVIASPQVDSAQV